jgi:hypothetical protein
MVETLIAGAVGPYGAVCVLLLILVGIYRFVTNHAVPIAKTYVEGQQQGLKDILAEHKEDRRAFQESISTLAKRQDKLEDDVDDIKTDVKKIMEKI